MAKLFSIGRTRDSRGHPHYALHLPDKRVLLVYGYRHRPSAFALAYSIRNVSALNWRRKSSLRDDGGNADLGYPWATMISKHRALVVYYFNRANAHDTLPALFWPWSELSSALPELRVAVPLRGIKRRNSSTQEVCTLLGHFALCLATFTCVSAF